jgi:4-amino-4-deoxy-L-arabinose transferase-like glycosyltransferase
MQGASPSDPVADRVVAAAPDAAPNGALGDGARDDGDRGAETDGDAGATGQEPIAPPGPSMSAGRFRVWMLLPLGVATAIQVAYLRHIHTWTFHNGDATYYDLQAHFMTDGHLFVNPYLAAYGLALEPSASHPPLTTLVLTGADFLGATTWGWHQALMAGVFVITVGICALVGRRLAGPRAGIVVALVVAVDPYLWVNPGAVLAETVEMLLVALLLWASLRFWDRPRLRTAGEIGLYLGLAALTRAELILLVFMIGLPLVLLCRGLTRGDRVRDLVVMGIVFVMVVGPWVGRNTVTFHQPEYLSTEGGVTLATANCPQAYYGDTAGWWDYSCAANVKFPTTDDESDTDHELRHIGLQYIEHHEPRQLEVMGIRVLRTWNLFRPAQQASFDSLDARPQWVTELGTYYFYVLVPFAVAGGIFLRRRRLLLFPLVSLVITATLAGALLYANGRYRTEGDLGVAILGAVGIEALIRARWRPALRQHARGQHRDGGPRPGPY